MLGRELGTEKFSDGFDLGVEDVEVLGREEELGGVKFSDGFTRGVLCGDDDVDVLGRELGTEKFSDGFTRGVLCGDDDVDVLGRDVELGGVKLSDALYFGAEGAVPVLNGLEESDPPEPNEPPEDDGRDGEDDGELKFCDGL